METNNIPYELTQPERSEGWKQLIIARKDLNMSPGKLAVQVSHGSMAWLTSTIKRHFSLQDETLYPVTLTPQMYRHPDLYHLAIAAQERGDEFFHAKKQEDGHIRECKPEPYYRTTFDIDVGIFEGWIQGSFTKVVCEARNRDQLLKATTIAQELGLEEGKDYFLIKDNCLTELTPEEVDENGVGRTLTVVGFRPLEASTCEKISKKFQLYR